MQGILLPFNSHFHHRIDYLSMSFLRTGTLPPRNPATAEYTQYTGNGEEFDYDLFGGEDLSEDNDDIINNVSRLPDISTYDMEDDGIDRLRQAIEEQEQQELMDEEEEVGGSVASVSVQSVRQVSVTSIPEFRFSDIHADYTLAREKWGNGNRLLYVFEVPLTVFGESLYGSGTSDCQDLILSNIQYQDKKCLSIKMGLMLIGATITIGSKPTAAMKRDMTQFNRMANTAGGPRFFDNQTQQYFHVTKEDLNASILNDKDAPRYQPFFSKCPAYSAMLGTNQNMFQLVKDEEIGRERVTTRGLDEDGEEIISHGINRLVHRKVIHLPCFSVYLEELVDVNFQPEGWRIWIDQHDPSINVGKNLMMLIDENLRISNQSSASSRRGGGRTSHMCSPETEYCYRSIKEKSDYVNLLRSRTSRIVGLQHPVRNISGTPGLPLDCVSGNPIHPANVFHPWYAVTCGSVSGVCPAQRDPANYFILPTDQIIGEGLTPDVIREYNSTENLNNAIENLPKFNGSFPFDILCSHREASFLRPERFHNIPFPPNLLNLRGSIEGRALENDSLLTRMRDLNPSLRDSCVVSSFPLGDDPDADPLVRLNSDLSILGIDIDARRSEDTKWDEVIEEARRLSENEDFDKAYSADDLRRFFQREQVQASSDVLSELPISEEDKARLYKADALMRFQVKKSTEWSKFHREDYDDNKDFCDAVEIWQRKSLKEMDEVCNLCFTDPFQMPASFVSGYAFFMSQVPDMQRPEFLIGAKNGRNGEYLSTYANMRIQINNGLKVLFLLNEGETQQAAYRAMLSRNSALQLAFSSIKCNLILWGPAGASKSYTLECIEKISHPGSVLNVTHLTENTFTTEDNMSYIWIIMHEGEALIIGQDKNGKETGGDATFKNILTSGLATAQMCQVIEGHRRRVNSCSIVMASFAICNNYYLPDEDHPVHSRLLRDIVPARSKGVSPGMLAAEQGIKWKNIPAKTQETMKLKYRVWHFLCHALERLIGGIFREPNMDIWDIRIPKFIEWMDHRCRLKVRKQEMIKAAARSSVIMHAVYCHFCTDVSRSDFLRPDGNPRKFSFVDFLGIDKHMVLTEEIFVDIMSLFHRFYTPQLEIDMMIAIAAMLNGHGAFYANVPTRPAHIERRALTTAILTEEYHSTGEYRRPRNAAEEQQQEDDIQRLASESGHVTRRPTLSVSHGRSRLVPSYQSGRRQEEGSGRRSAQEIFGGTGRSDEGSSADDGLRRRRNVPSLIAGHFPGEGTTGTTGTSGTSGISGTSGRFSSAEDELTVSAAYQKEKNYILLPCKSIRELVQKLSNHMTVKYHEDPILSVLTSWCKKTMFLVKDMNEVEPRPRKLMKVLKYFEYNHPDGSCSIGPAASRRRPTSGKFNGVYAINVGAMIEKYKALDFPGLLEAFMSHAACEKGNYITSLPYSEEKGERSILKTINVGPDSGNILVRESYMPQMMSNNDLVFASLENPEACNTIQTVSSYDDVIVWRHLDWLAFYAHYMECGHFVEDDPREMPRYITTYPKTFVHAIWKFRQIHRERYEITSPHDIYPDCYLMEIRGRKSEQQINRSRIANHRKLTRAQQEENLKWIYNQTKHLSMFNQINGYYRGEDSVDQPLTIEQEKQMEAIMERAISGGDSDDQSGSLGEITTRRDSPEIGVRRTFARFSVRDSTDEGHNGDYNGERHSATERSVPMPRIREIPASLSGSMDYGIDDDLLKRKPVSRSHNKRSRERAISNTALRSKRMRSILRVRVGLAEREVTISGSSENSTDLRDSRDSRSLEESQSLDIAEDVEDAEVLRQLSDGTDDDSFI